MTELKVKRTFVFIGGQDLFRAAKEALWKNKDHNWSNLIRKIRIKNY